MLWNTLPKLYIVWSLLGHRIAVDANADDNTNVFMFLSCALIFTIIKIKEINFEPSVKSTSDKNR